MMVHTGIVPGALLMLDGLLMLLLVSLSPSSPPILVRLPPGSPWPPLQAGSVLTFEGPEGGAVVLPCSSPRIRGSVASS